MRKLKFGIAVSLISVFALSTAVSAEVEVSQDFDEGTISFSGETALPEDFVNVKIQKGDVDALVLEGKSGAGSEYGFIISPSFETGIYDISVRTYELRDKGSFAYVNADDADNVFEVLNGEPKNSDVEDMFKNEKKRIVLQGLDYDYTKLSDKSALYAALIENAEYSGDLSEKMRRLRAVGILCTIYESTTPEQAKRITDTYADMLGVSAIDAYILDSKDYIKADFANKLYEQIRGLDVYDLDEFLEAYREKAVLCAAKSLESSEYIGELLNDMNENIKYTEFARLSASQRAKIGTELTFSETYTNVPDMVKAFDDKVEKASEDNDPDNAGGGNAGGGLGGFGGGGGGGSSQPTSNSVMNVENEPTEEVDFEDMDGYSWAAEAVEYLKNLGVINGYDERTFAPSKNVTREEFVKMIVSAFKISAESTDIKFDDVQYGEWYYDSVMNAAGAMIINGVADNWFGTGQDITRQDAASIIFRTLNYKGILLDVGEVDFVDKDEIAEYAYDAISALKNAGYIKGNGDNTFAPKRFLSRAEAAQMVYSAIWRGEK